MVAEGIIIYELYSIFSVCHIYIFGRLNGLVLLGPASKFDGEDIWWRYYNHFTILILVTISCVRIFSEEL